MNYRKEIKYVLAKSELARIKEYFFLNGLEKLYPKRIINSFYYDTKNLRMLNESIDGILPRKKVRFRWYNNDKSNISKEIKISSENGRFKKIENLKSKDYIDFERSKFYEINYGIVEPTLYIKYFREYFTFKKLRITFDTQIRYSYLQSKLSTSNLDNENVMEVKASDNISNNYIEKIIHLMPSSFSKYTRGMLSFNNLKI